ncbi:hypothetical protein M7I_6359 [Glarea lozoyensis 74030]|uniref:Uncharacterized protein n=1 Tax=Glarea lozoyensis (strain ATCC 74030 / MF5533) TaxID=1104152 RepID=H0EUC6_GLAL7|nr:hypothetical protein M7I_6359 [Glarea lozoyensis 74030]
MDRTGYAKYGKQIGKWLSSRKPAESSNRFGRFPDNKIDEKGRKFKISKPERKGGVWVAESVGVYKRELGGVFGPR